MDWTKHAARLFDRAKHNMKPDTVDPTTQQPSRWRIAFVNWRTKRAIRKFERNWRLLAPYQRLTMYIQMLDENPELRRSMREVLGLDAKMLTRPGSQREPASRIVTMDDAPRRREKIIFP
jgi:hypothetical protein